jgi:hypothetical protein
MEASLKQNDKFYEQNGLENGSEQIKQMILETDPILFIVTMVVSCLHSVFEVLAIKNDISFWKNVESHKGLSL